MQVQLNIGFDQLLKIVKGLPVAKLLQLKAEIGKGVKDEKSSNKLVVEHNFVNLHLKLHPKNPNHN